MADYFPEDVLGDILARLPIESLVQCISVCKFWYSLITGPNFISFHSKRISSSTNKSLLLVRDYTEQADEHFSLHFDDEPFEETKTLDFPLASSFDDTSLRVVGSINGVVCLSDDIEAYNDLIVLWNPTIRKFVTLPHPIFGSTDWGSFLGFGFDAASNDFKVVRIVYPYEDQQKMGVTLPHAEVYEPRVGSWRSVDTKGLSCITDGSSPQALLHGTIHWVVVSKNELDDLNSTNMIVTFDLSSEEFGAIKLPDSLAENTMSQEFGVAVMGESLALIHDTWSDDGNVCCIWVLKQYGVSDSWTKQFSVDVTGGYWRVCGFRRNGEALVKADSQHHLHREHVLFSFEPKSKQVKYLRDFGIWSAFFVDNFVESLALLGVKGESLAKGKSSNTTRTISRRSPDDVPWWLEDAYRYLETADLSVSEIMTQFLGQFVVHLFYDTPC